MTNTARQNEDPDRLRAKLATSLSFSDDVRFFRLIWALNALQTGRVEEARPFLASYPQEAATEGIIGKHAIYPWELETLANELLTTPKHAYYRFFDYSSWNAISETVNLVRELSGAEYTANPDKPHILVEMGRIGARQFPWQRGFFGIPQIYRNTFIYGQGECANYLNENFQLTAFDMTLVGFALTSVFYASPAIHPADDLHLIHEFGIDADTLARAIARISCPLSDLRYDATQLRNTDAEIAYKPSIFRQYPCVHVGHRNRTMIAPLPDLIMDRVTNGLFYDVIGGGGAVREEIGQRFEEYSLTLLRGMLTDATFEPEVTYSTQLGPVATPDIRVLADDGTVQLVIECKASRMSVNARFGEAPEEDRGYEEIAKGVMQLWRFFAHCGKENGPNRLVDNPQGMILTLDEWFAGRATVIPEIMERAGELADGSAHPISLEDRRSVAFCTVSELESVLKTATIASLLETVEIGSGDRAGWIFSTLHREAKAEKTEQKEYPFEQALGELLPWYALL
ncbi:MAG: hypothetical protein ABJ360_13450, partial [Roseobacter sp.]